MLTETSFTREHSDLIFGLTSEATVMVESASRG